MHPGAAKATKTHYTIKSNHDLKLNFGGDFEEGMLGAEAEKHSQAKHLLKKIILECQHGFPD